MIEYRCECGHFEAEHTIAGGCAGCDAGGQPGYAIEHAYRADPEWPESAPYALPPIGSRQTFRSPYEYGPDHLPNLADVRGQTVTVTGHIIAADSEHDAEVLPMLRVAFDSGVEIEAWPEEIEA